MLTDLYFNTGVRPWNSSHLGKGDKFINNEKHILFICDLPDGFNNQFAFACDNPGLPGNYLVFPIVGGNMLSKFAYFKK